MSKTKKKESVDTSTFGFDDSYKVKRKELNDLKDRLRWADELTRPLIELSIEKAEKEFADEYNVPAQNIQRLFDACKHLNIPRIWIGDRELVGADDVRQEDTWQPAIWKLKHILDRASHMSDGIGFASSCGNGDQTQTENTDSFIPPQYINKAWDVETQEEIKDITPFQKRMVVSDEFRKLRIPPDIKD